MEELGIYLLAFDRAGYGESDPNPRRDVKSEALDIEELADQLELGQKFYVLGTSMAELDQLRLERKPASNSCGW